MSLYVHEIKFICTERILFQTRNHELIIIKAFAEFHCDLEIQRCWQCLHLMAYDELFSELNKLYILEKSS